MSDKSQKALKKLAAVILGIVFVVFAVLFVIGQVEDFVTDSGTSSGGAVSVVTSDVNSSLTENVQSAPNVSSSQSEDVTSSKSENVSESAPVSSAQTAQTVSAPQSTGITSSAPEVFSSQSADVTSSVPEVSSSQNTETRTYKFRNKNLLDQHYEKHGKYMGFSSAEEYEKAASAVVNDPSALHKTEKEDGDDVYYIESTNEFVIVSTDGYIRTYFNPDRGIDYYNKQ